jgi:16S rRNA C967 or C1407 C5-methylase (RsmB/RsmF family)
MWNPDMIKRLAGLQRKLLVNAWSLLKPGGTLVYSTCSQEPEEDEAIIDFAIKNLDGVKVEQVKLPHLKSTTPITSFDGKEYSPEVKKCLRLWPQDNDTEGFFVAKLVKKA